MRSKCRCSCVLQFTLCRAFSCVLHRLPSQLIHCTALYEVCSLGAVLKEKKPMFHKCANPGGGKHKPSRPWQELLDGRLRHQGLAGRLGPREARTQKGSRTKGPGLSNHKADKPRVLGEGGASRQPTKPEKNSVFRQGGPNSCNDPSAGSPTETLLRLLLPLSATVWSSFRQRGRVNRQEGNPRTSLKHSIGSSDGRCVQRAGT